MEETRLIRQVDDLGRVVIPKEIRRKLRIVEGDKMEIFVGENSVTFKRYDLLHLSPEIVRAISAALQYTEGEYAVYDDNDTRLAYKGNSMPKRTPAAVSEHLWGRAATSAFVNILDNDKRYWVAPLMSGNRVYGCICGYPAETAGLSVLSTLRTVQLMFEQLMMES